MSGDSPNAFANENVFDFKEGRSSPAPTTSKDSNPPPGGVVNASVLVEPPKEKKDAEKEKDEDKPDFSTPILNPGHEDSLHGEADADKASELGNSGFEGRDKDKKEKQDKKEEQNLLNGDPNKSAYPPIKDYEDGSEEDPCIVNCLYYTMECCKCSIL